MRACIRYSCDVGGCARPPEARLFGVAAVSWFTGISMPTLPERRPSFPGLAGWLADLWSPRLFGAGPPSSPLSGERTQRAQRDWGSVCLTDVRTSYLSTSYKQSGRVLHRISAEAPPSQNGRPQLACVCGPTWVPAASGTHGQLRHRRCHEPAAVARAAGAVLSAAARPDVRQLAGAAAAAGS